MTKEELLLIKKAEEEMLNKFDNKIFEFINSFEDGGINKKVFDFDNKNILQDDWNLGNRSGKYAMLNKFSYELGCILGELYKDFMDKWEEK